MRVLLIDDDDDVREYLKLLLGKSGHSVESFDKARDALKRLFEKGDEIDVILSDVRMPDMNGLEFLERIKLGEVEIPTILMTGYPEIDISIKALRLGASDLLLKPFHSNILLQILNRIKDQMLERSKFLDIFSLSKIDLEIIIPSQMSQISNLILLLKRMIQPYCQIYKLNVQQLLTGYSEAVTNALIHGNLEVSSTLKEQSWEEFDALVKLRSTQSPYQDRKIKVDLTINNQHIALTVKDEGGGFNHQYFKKQNESLALIASGRGLFLIQLFMDQVSWDDEGNSIMMVKNFQMEPQCRPMNPDEF